MTRLRAMVVEDEAVIGETAKVLLTQLGFGPVSVVSNGEEAVKRALRDKPDLILMDINLGTGLNGIDASARIREQSKAPIVLTTGYDEGMLEARERLSPCYMMTKPYGEKELRALTRKVFGAKRAAAPARKRR